jgi:DNA-binding transcriptional ArsR family regulator
MHTVEETRRVRLKMLVDQHDGVAQLAEKLDKSQSSLSRVLNANIRHDRDGEPYVMGGPVAREIETVLGLPKGWMDTPPTYAELLGEQDQRTKVMALMESMPQDQWGTVVRLVDALAQPAPEQTTPATGTHGKQ